MRIIACGSIATDNIMQFPGKFSDQLIADQLDKVSLSFLVDELAINYGGVAANIAYGMGLLGLRPVLCGAVGADFDADYRQWLEKHGVDTSGVRVSGSRHTARFLCTTDEVQNQIASFYAGAMSEAREIALAPVVEQSGGVDMVIISADDPEGMVRHADECREQGYPFAADPGQQLARAGGDDIRRMVDGATHLFTNEYEAELLQQKTGWSADEVLSRVGSRVTTRGAGGLSVETAGQPRIDVAAAATDQVKDPTGGGDAWRSGYFAGLSWGVGTERAAQVGCLLATHVLECDTAQDYGYEAGAFVTRFAEHYGKDAAAEIEPHLAAAR